MLNTDENKFVSNESIGAQLHTPPESFSDSFALFITKTLRFFADTLFRKRYGHRAVVLETVAGVPGMVAGVVHHLRSLRNMKDDNGMIKELLDEAENERMHLMTFIEIAKPSRFERFLILLAIPFVIEEFNSINKASNQIHLIPAYSQSINFICLLRKIFLVLRSL